MIRPMKRRKIAIGILLFDVGKHDFLVADNHQLRLTYLY